MQVKGNLNGQYSKAWEHSSLNHQQTSLSPALSKIARTNKSVARTSRSALLRLNEPRHMQQVAPPAPDKNGVDGTRHSNSGAAHQDRPLELLWFGESYRGCEGAEFECVLPCRLGGGKGASAVGLDFLGSTH